MTLLTSDRLIAQVKQHVKEVDVHQLKQKMDDGQTVVVDIREFDEYAQGTIPARTTSHADSWNCVSRI
ncbi:MAG: hypothetical protein JSV81_06970 [Anaerolineales bacterium]|nr:MAG: hypothetical protein JSV81_06970 [Anaerolineales bacterium]